MKTLHKVDNLKGLPRKTYFEVFEHNGHKFSIHIWLDNGICTGFNSDCCLSVMTADGDFKHIADNHMLGFTYRDLRTADDIRELSVSKFKEFVENVY